LLCGVLHVAAKDLLFVDLVIRTEVFHIRYKSPDEILVKMLYALLHRRVHQIQP